MLPALSAGAGPMSDSKLCPEHAVPASPAPDRNTVWPIHLALPFILLLSLGLWAAIWSIAMRCFGVMGW